LDKGCSGTLWETFLVSLDGSLHSLSGFNLRIASQLTPRRRAMKSIGLSSRLYTSDALTYSVYSIQTSEIVEMKFKKNVCYVVS